MSQSKCLESEIKRTPKKLSEILKHTEEQNKNYSHLLTKNIKQKTAEQHLKSDERKKKKNQPRIREVAKIPVKNKEVQNLKEFITSRPNHKCWFSDYNSQKTGSLIITPKIPSRRGLVT